MRRSSVLKLLILIALIWTTVFAAPHFAEAATLPTVVYTQNTCTNIWSKPTISSTLIADVIGGTSLQVVSESSDNSWYQVMFLGSVSAWVSTSDVSAQYPQNAYTDGGCNFTNIIWPIPVHPVTSAPGPFPLQTAGIITKPGLLRASPNASAMSIQSVAVGATAIIDQYAADGNGDIWYHAQVNGVTGWLWAYMVLLNAPNPATQTVQGKPIWYSISGKGMWFTNYFTRHTEISALIAAAKAAGITHIYPEVAISNDGGFFGADSLNRLLPVAHAAGISVIAAVYPSLSNVSADIQMTKMVWDYRTPSGDHVDGILADIEANLYAPRVYAYGQVLRQIVGPNTPLVANTLNPYSDPTYPYPEIAANFNVIAPMDYWHGDPHKTYTPQDAAALLMNSIISIDQQLGGINFPIEELGQMYDMFTSDGAPGGYQPSGGEIYEDMLAAEQFGCIGVSFFEWQTASAQELQVFAAFKWK